MIKNKKKQKELPDCCKTKKGIKEGIFYGLIPHTGCIAFIIGSVLGVTILMNFFRPLLMSRYFFHWLFVIALGFATFSSFLYLRKNKLLSLEGIKLKKKYLITMYGSTIGINLILFMVIFPLLANVSLTGAVVFDGNPEDLENIKLSVNIPCPGHAPLISNELGTISGVINTRYSFPNNFDVRFDKTETNLGKILSLEVFEEYPVTVLGNSNSENLQESNNPQTQNTRGCCGCGRCG